MSYRIELLPRAVKALAALSKADQLRLDPKIQALGEDPRPPGVKVLQGVRPTTYRLRVGDFRVLYTVDDGVALVLVVEIGNRREVYRR